MEVKVDGRALRSVRSRQQIIDAMLALMEREIYIPTAQQVADEAGISIRTVFRHFTEMELLYAELNSQVRPVYEALFNKMPVEGSLEERLTGSVRCRMEAFAQLIQLQRATWSLLWRSQVISDVYASNVRKMRKNLEKCLPEILQLPADKREAVDAIMSFEFYERLSRHQKLSDKACGKVVEGLLKDLLT
ncbi:TetR/AcrR family transcriptional regulator [Microbulbifer agarilyticus]|uniref:TetR/AcrR family transcriptional regulator n=1 Tax=Microbulbifer agarilyticus TaxID=260552 RepID=UPI001CD1B7CD|nr:TetR/AcrR family transcriptional regulator [Microbulbifer agarilyticus]MCA0900308.1 TetR/AcrR family transcriptional regulator [Microbulbifer agarilyticus]